MLRRCLYLLALCAWFPLQSFAAITATTLIPFGTEYIGDATSLALPAGATYGTQLSGGSYITNKNLVHFNTPRPASIAAGNSRHTVAMDVLFEGNYLTDNLHPSHLILATRHSGVTYMTSGDNRALGIAAGHLWGDGRVYVEEVEMDGPDYNRSPIPPYANINHAGASVLTANTWYRISVESIALSGGIAFEARIWNIATGALIYSVPTIWSAFPANYNLAWGRVTIGNLHSSTGRVKISNLKSYWSNGGEWVSNP